MTTDSCLAFVRGIIVPKGRCFFVDMLGRFCGFLKSVRVNIEITSRMPNLLQSLNDVFTVKNFIISVQIAQF